MNEFIDAAMNDNLTNLNATKNDEIAKLRKENKKLKKALGRSMRGFVLTQEYCMDMLPFIDGWEWYDSAKMISEIIPESQWTKQFEENKLKSLEGKE